MIVCMWCVCFHHFRNPLVLCQSRACVHAHFVVAVMCCMAVCKISVLIKNFIPMYCNDYCSIVDTMTCQNAIYMRFQQFTKIIFSQFGTGTPRMELTLAQFGTGTPRME